MRGCDADKDQHLGRAFACRHPAEAEVGAKDIGDLGAEDRLKLNRGASYPTAALTIATLALRAPTPLVPSNPAQL